MKGCLTIIGMLFLLTWFYEISPLLFWGWIAIWLIYAIGVFSFQKEYTEQKAEADLVRQKRIEEKAKEKEEFDRGYWHGFQDGMRDSRNIAMKSLYDRDGNELYMQGYKKGYPEGFNFNENEDDDDEDDDKD